jgi:ABC-type phosphate transport system permease subunit
MAAAASITLIVLLAAMNSVAIILREHFRRRLNP